MLTWKTGLTAMMLSVGCSCLFPNVLSAETKKKTPSKRLTTPFFALRNCTLDDKHKSPQSQAALLGELGYAGIGCSGKDEIPEMLSALDEHGLKMFAVYLGVDLNPEKPPYDPGLKETIKVLKGRNTIVWLYIRSNKHKRSSPDGDPRAVEIVREVAKMARASGLRVALYPHVGFWMERIEDVVRIAKKVDLKNVGVTFNLCHWLIIEDESTLKARLKLAMPRLFVVTINGIAHDVTRSSRKGWIQTLDRGSYDVSKFLDTLNGMGYTGPIGLQCWSIKGDVHDNLTRSMTAWRKQSANVTAVKKGGQGVKKN